MLKLNVGNFCKCDFIQIFPVISEVYDEDHINFI